MALLAAGVAAIVFKLTISPKVVKRMEMAVAFVLILLGGQVLVRSLGAWSLHRHEHSHDGWSHSHFHLHGGAEPGDTFTCSGWVDGPSWLDFCTGWPGARPSCC